MSAQELEVVSESTALAISVKGEVLTSNFLEFEQYVVDRIKAVNDDITTPEHVEQGKEDIKELKAFVQELAEKEEQVLKEMNQVYALLQGTGRLKGLADEKRKAIDKKVKDISAKIKQTLIDKGISALELDTPANRQAVEKATFRKSSPESMGKAIDDVVDALNLAYQKNFKAIAECKAEHGEAVCYDEKVLLSMPGEMLTIELERRIERHRAEVEKAKLKAELEAEKKTAADKLAAEKAAKESEAVNKESSQEDVIPSTTAETTPQGNLPTQQDKPSGVPRANTVSGNHLDPRPAENAEVGMTAKQEMDQFLEDIPAVFAQFREKRLALVHPENQEKALIMSDAVNGGWKKFKASI